MYKAKVEVGLKPGHSDPEGETIAESLRELNFPVTEVQVSKVYTVFLEASSMRDAENKVDEMCLKLLSNPTKDDYTYEIKGR